MKVLGISGSKIGDRLPAAVEFVLKKVKELSPNIETELMDLRDYDIEIVDGRLLKDYNIDTQTAIAKILQADFYVIGSPVYQASISGALKNLFDHLPMDAFQSKVVGLIMTGGTEKHFLVLENQLKPIISFFKGYIASKHVYIHTDVINKNKEIADKDTEERMIELAKELVFLQTKLHG